MKQFTFIWKSFVLSTLVIVFELLTASIASADFIAIVSLVTKPNALGIEYIYTVTNPTENGADGDNDFITAFDVGVSANANLMTITTPIGFRVEYANQSESIQWIADDFEPALSVGESAQFSFVSTLAPGESNFNVSAINQVSSGGNLDLFSGSIPGPFQTVAVPEPTSFIPLGIGLTTLAGYSVSRGRRE